MEFMETDSISPETGRPMFTSRLFIISLWLIFRPKTLSHKNFQTKVYFWYLKLLGRAENFCFDWSEWLFEWFYLSKEVTPGYKLVYLLGHSRKEYSKYHAKHQHLITTWQFEDHVTQNYVTWWSCRMFQIDRIELGSYFFETKWQLLRNLSPCIIFKES